ncbi:MAG: hypothetical protein J0H61_07035, partial [Alphaproteobacteria bacterium]|nr:hypothetical protein [Alphaproteobacteria bacterium]
PVAALFAAAGALGRAGVPLQWHLARGMGHGIDEAGVALAGLFMAQAFAGRLRTQSPVSSPL